MYIETFFITHCLFAPIRWAWSPSFIEPEKSLPVATGPSLGSTCILVMHITVGPFQSHFNIAFPTSEFGLPFQIFEILYRWASSGLGLFLTIACSIASWIG